MTIELISLDGVFPKIYYRDYGTAVFRHLNNKRQFLGFLDSNVKSNKEKTIYRDTII